MQDPRTDQQLVAAANAGGDQAARAFEAIYGRYRDWVVSLAYRFTGNRDLALDVMQEAFMYLLRKFPGFQLTAQFKTFLYPVVKHLSIAANKKARRYANPAATDEGDYLDQIANRQGAFMPPESEPGASARAELQVVLSDLSDDHRETVLLRFVDDLSLEEIAAATSVPVGTVKSRLHHALRKLREDPRVRDYFAPP